MSNDVYRQLRENMKKDLCPIDPLNSLEPICSADHVGERPNIFVRFRILLFVVVVIGAITVAAIQQREPERPVPDYRWGTRHNDTPCNACAVSDPNNETAARVYVAPRGNGVHVYHPDSTYWV